MQYLLKNIFMILAASHDINLALSASEILLMNEFDIVKQCWFKIF